MTRRLSTSELRARGGALLGEAAERSRVSLRTRRQELLESARPIVHTAAGATGAWLVATEVVGHERPFFAPIAAVITLGLSAGQRSRRAVEIALGVAIGIGVADVLVIAIGTGTAQIGLVVALAMAVSLLLGGGPLVTSQAAVSAVLVATLQTPSDGLSLERFVDALVGGGIGLAAAALILPANPLELIRRAAEPLLGELAVTLEHTAEALEKRDEDIADRALVRSRDLDSDLDLLLAAATDARENSRLGILHRRSRKAAERYRLAARHLDFAVGNARVLARGAGRAIQLDDATPPMLTDALRELAAAVRLAGTALEGRDADGEARVAVLRAAGVANAVLEQTGNMSALHLVAQVRSAAVDLLRAIGLDRAEAERAVRGARPPSGAAPRPAPR